MYEYSHVTTTRINIQNISTLQKALLCPLPVNTPAKVSYVDLKLYFMIIINTGYLL